MYKLKSEDIRYFGEQDKLYTKGLNDAKTLNLLKELVDDYELIAGEAKDTVDAWNDQDFKDFRKCLWHERRKQYTGDTNAKRFVSVILPNPMFRISMISNEMNVCFGLVFKRFMETGIGIIKNGRLELNLESSTS